MCTGVSRNDGEWWLGGKVRADDEADAPERQRWSIFRWHSRVLSLAVGAWVAFPIALDHLSRTAVLLIAIALFVWLLVGFWCEGSARRRLAGTRNTSDPTRR
jgi:hypothetical protein